MKPEVIASRRTFDNKTVQLWSDGMITWAFGQYIRGAPRKPGLDVGWAVLGEVEIVDSDDVPLLIKAAQKGGLPGEIRSRFHAMKRREETHSEVPAIHLDWQTIDTDRDGRVTARVAVLPRLMYPGLAIWHERGKYEIMRKVTRSPMGYLPSRSERGRGSDTYEPTGFRGTTLASVLAQLPELRDRELSLREQTPTSPYQDWYEQSQEELRDYVEISNLGGLSDEHTRENLSVDDFQWEFRELPVSTLLRIWPKTQWLRWYKGERDARRNEDGNDDYFDQLEQEWGIEPSPIGPIVVVRIGKEYDIGDGWHRAAIAVAKGWATIPAVVGTR
jgi:hypothetical protein